MVAFDTMGLTGGREASGGFTPDRFLMGPTMKASLDTAGIEEIRTAAR